GQGDRLKLAAACVSHQSDECAGIDASREEGADRHISHKMLPNTVEQRLTDQLSRGALANGLPLGLAVRRCNRVVTNGSRGPDPINSNKGPGWNGANVSQRRIGLRHASPNIEAHDTGRIAFARDPVTCQQGFHLRSKANSPSIISVVKRFDAVR